MDRFNDKFFSNHSNDYSTFKCLLIIFGILNSVNADSHTKKALFIGNSATSQNDLPQLTHDVAISVGDTLIFESHTVGNSRFSDHANNQIVFSKINSKDWNYVILQGHSMELSFRSEQINSEVLPFAKLLCDSIRSKNPCTIPIFFTPWALENGDQLNCPSHPEVCTYEGMNDLISQQMSFIANENQGYLSPVAQVWLRLRRDHPEIELFVPDGIHPTPAGSFAAACTTYTILFQKDPSLLNYDFTLTSLEANIIRRLVKEIVFDNLSMWNIGVFEPDPNCDQLLTNVSSQYNQIDLKIFPNPSDGHINIEFNDQIFGYQLLDLQGEVLVTVGSQISKEIDLTKFDLGIYFIKIRSSKGKIYLHKIIKL